MKEQSGVLTLEGSFDSCVLPQCTAANDLYQRELHQSQKILIIKSMMSMNPLLMPEPQRIPLAPSPLRPPLVDRDVFSSTVAPTDLSQCCVPSWFRASVLPNANLPSQLSSQVYSGWGILPPESTKAVARRNELIQRHRAARAEMEMCAIYQQRRMERVNPRGLTGLGLPLLYGSSGPGGPTAYHGRNILPATDLHVHRSTLRHSQGNPILVATGPHFIQGSGQRYHWLKRGMGNQKPLDKDPASCQSQAEERILDQVHSVSHKEDEYVKEPELEVCNSQNSREIHERPTTTLARHCGELQPTQRKPSSLAAKVWDDRKEKPWAQGHEACEGRDGVCPPGSPSALPGTCVLVTVGENHSLDGDIQKWSVDDVHNFITSLPGCSDYAQVFKDHAIDGETLPLLTEEHLRSTMGLKLGPALKIQSQVSQHMGSMFSKKTHSLPTHTAQAFDRPVDTAPLLDFNPCSDSLGIPCPQDTMSPQRSEQDSMRN